MDISRWQEYWKGILAFLTPGAVIIGSSVTSDSDGGSTITTSEWVTAIVAMIVTGGLVTIKGNAAAPVVAVDPEAGVGELSIVGLVIVVVAVLLMLAKALGVFHGIALIWLILLLVLGAAIWLYARYPSRRVR